MASPQLEDGYARVANELLEALARIRIPGEAMQVFIVILRKTYGFGKKEDRISLSQFHLATGITKPHIIRGIRVLLSMHLITKKGNGDIPTYCINKDYSTWRALPKKVTLPKKETSVAQKGKNRCPKRYPQKKKETIQKKPSPEALRLAGLLANLILRNNPSHRNLNGKREKTEESWAVDIDKLIRLDKQTPQDVETVIKWCQADSFWWSNIQSGKKLREQWDQLYSKMRFASRGGNGRQESMDASGRPLREL
jgi:phage replication O-like protein O